MSGGKRVWVPSALFGLALALRAAAALQTAAIFNDGPAFLRVAGLFQRGEWSQALSHHYHPLYPSLVSLVARLSGGLESAAVVVSVVAGSLGVVALYAFLRRAFDERVAWVGGVLFALHPYAVTFSADVQSEGLYFTLFLATVAGLWRALMDRSAAWAALSGALAGVAYWTRPEGLGLAAVGIAFAALLLFQGRWSAPFFARWAAALALGSVVVVAPYVVHLHGLTGEWMLTQKKSIGDLTGSGGSKGVSEDAAPDRQRWAPPPMRRPAPRQAGLLPARIDFEPRSIAAGVELVAVSASALSPVIVVLLGIGVFTLRGRLGARGNFLLLIVGLYAVVLYGLALNVGYLNRRHVLAPLLPLLGYAAVAVPVVGAGLLRAVRLGVDKQRTRSPVWVGLALVAALTLPKTLAAHREERIATRRAAEWLAGRSDLSGPVAAAKARTAYYAGEVFVHLSREGSGSDVRRLRRAGARFLVIDDAQIASRPAVAAQWSGLAEIHRVEASGRTAFVYDLATP
ncbi:MAG: glycosyltransferase family 39 protein [Myxococcota bacterium]|nr:glycosyltransferase family 39 protein [Myxococcota bacterium]